MSEELQYLHLIQRILEKGTEETTRNGVTKSVFGECMRFSLQEGTIPLFTTKKMPWKTIFFELMWFLRGEIDNKILQEKGVHIWDGNATRGFLDSRNLQEYPEGFLGPIYGWQWRRWNQSIPEYHVPGKKQGMDQIYDLIEQLKDPEKRTSRRLIVSAWNPEQLDKMALPPCHVMMQFHVRSGEYLSCALFQRSGDVGLGVPFNIASYAFLVHILAKHCGLIADELVYFLGNAHIYESHMDALKIQYERKNELFAFPKLCIKRKHEDIGDYTIEDIEWKEQYQYHDTIKMPFVP